MVAQTLGAEGQGEGLGLGLFMVDATQPGVALQPTLLADIRNHARLTLTGVQVADDLRLPATAGALQALDAALDRARI